jgi:hypothetical protein
MLREGAVSATPGLDVGQTRTFLPDGGKIQPITAKAVSKEGGRESFAAFDESHLFITPELHRLHDTNAAKRKVAEPWGRSRLRRCIRPARIRLPSSRTLPRSASETPKIRIDMTCQTVLQSCIVPDLIPDRRRADKMILLNSKRRKPFTVVACFPYGTESLGAVLQPRRTLARRRSS